MIFSNILDIYNFTAKMLSSVEEQVEVAAENETPTVGICFQDIAEVITVNPVSNGHFPKDRNWFSRPIIA